MAYDGKLLAAAREALAEKRQKNEAEHARRLMTAYTCVPALAEADAEIARTMSGIATRALDGGSMKAEFESSRARVQRLCDKKAQLLAENGMAPDFLDETYSCPVCRDTGYVAGRMCDCLKKAYHEQSVRALSSALDLRGQCFDCFDLSYYSDSAEKNGDSPRSIMTATYDFCRKYATEFHETSPNLLFRGGTGLGKTFLSACIAGVVAQKGFSVVYDTCVAVIDCFEAQKFGRGDYSEVSSGVNRYLGCDLLILDDLGTEMGTSFSQSAVYNLINTRLINGKKTVISTNLTPEELSARYSAATVSRLEGEYITLRFAGTDIRKLKRS